MTTKLDTGQLLTARALPTSYQTLDVHGGTGCTHVTRPERTKCKNHKRPKRGGPASGMPREVILLEHLAQSKKIWQSAKSPLAICETKFATLHQSLAPLSSLRCRYARRLRSADIKDLLTSPKWRYITCICCSGFH